MPETPEVAIAEIVTENDDEVRLGLPFLGRQGARQEAKSQKNEAAIAIHACFLSLFQLVRAHSLFQHWTAGKATGPAIFDLF